MDGRFLSGEVTATDGGLTEAVSETLESASPCKARDIGLDSFLLCLEENPRMCKFSLAFGGRYFCKCKSRVRSAEETL
ncbi:MAG: hypothetical protein AB1442_00215 [Nitrospirota bacterium]